MLFDKVPEAKRQAAIRLLENSLFDRVTQGAQWFCDVTPTLPGFNPQLPLPPSAPRSTLTLRHSR